MGVVIPIKSRDKADNITTSLELLPGCCSLVLRIPGCNRKYLVDARPTFKSSLTALPVYATLYHIAVPAESPTKAQLDVSLDRSSSTQAKCTIPSSLLRLRPKNGVFCGSTYVPPSGYGID